MARYDSPGYNTPLPGIPVFDSHAVSNAQGSGGAVASPDGGRPGEPVHVSYSFDSSQGGGYTVDQGALATQAASDPMADRVSDAVQDSAAWSAGSSHVIGPRHPNSMNRG
jgi:hypothetical protein